MQCAIGGRAVVVGQVLAGGGSGDAMACSRTRVGYHVAMRFSRGLGLFALAASIPAQTIWSMGAPYTNLDAVLTAAAPGDIVLLNGMLFAPFTLTKGLTILGPGTIRPSASGGGAVTTTIVVPAGERAHVAEVQFSSTQLSSTLGVAMHMVVAQGDVTFEQCAFHQGAPFCLDAAGNVLLRGCSVSGSGWSTSVAWGTGGGMRVNGGVCHLTDCQLQGTNAWLSGQIGALPASPGLRVASGSTVHLSQCTIVGGSGLVAIPSFAFPAPALIADGTVLIADSVVTGGAGLGLPGATGIVSNVPTFLARCLVQGGSGNPAGSATTGSSQALPGLVGLSLSQGWRLGQSSTLTANMGLTQLCAIFGTLDSTPTVHPDVFGAIRGSLASMVPLLVTMPTSSQVSCVFSVPPAASLLGTALFAQAFQLDGAVVRVSAAVGGVVR